MFVPPNQLARRNLLPAERIALTKRLEPAIRKQAKEQQLSGLKQNESVPSNLMERTPIDTQKEIAHAAGVSVGTLQNYETAIQSDAAGPFISPLKKDRLRTCGRRRRRPGGKMTFRFPIPSIY